MDEIEEKLKQQMKEFASNQPGYDRDKQIRILRHGTRFQIIYGKDEMSGIMGLGDTAPEAFNDFVRSWNQLKGFEWIKKNR